MDNVINGFLERNLPKFKNDITVTIFDSDVECYTLTVKNGKMQVEASTIIACCVGIYDYLKKYCNVQLSWCSNTTIDIDSLVDTNGTMSRAIEQKFRVYMNYCTLNYTMSWWDFERWEKEIDFMAMNGINMPLAVVGTEAVWFESLVELGFSEEEALSTISGPAFWAWQLMTNIEGYLPPKDKKYVYERLELGRKILNRYLEFGMQPIQQGFSGHVPMLMKQKYPNENIIEQKGWCTYPKTAQLDPTTKFFGKVGRVYLDNLEKLFGNYHYLACDPFHEGTPPSNTKEYLNAVGSAINNMYEDFDKDSIWVMQCWTPQKDIVSAIPKDRLLFLDLDSDRTAVEYKWVHENGYSIVSGMLHNFGGKNAMQGHLKDHCKNNYARLRDKGINAVGSGMFMEGIEQNPVIYDLQFQMLTEKNAIDFESWLDSYILRRYGTINDTLKQAWSILLNTCYRSDGYEENRVGSCLASRPQLMPIMTGPCCYTKLYYNSKDFEKAVALFLSLSDELGDVDAYQYDLCDMVRQALSNRFYDNQIEFRKTYKKLIKDKSKLKQIAKEQLELLLDLDSFLANRSEFTLARWINAAQGLATDEEEKHYFDFNARTQITLWGDIDGDTSQLFDYAWKEWNGLIKEYYYPRWQIFYDYVLGSLDKHRLPRLPKHNDWLQRRHYRKYPVGKTIDRFEQSWIRDYKEYPTPQNADVVPQAKLLVEKYSIS